MSFPPAAEGISRLLSTRVRRQEPTRLMTLERAEQATLKALWCIWFTSVLRRVCRTANVGGQRQDWLPVGLKAGCKVRRSAAAPVLARCRPALRLWLGFRLSPRGRFLDALPRLSASAYPACSTSRTHRAARCSLVPALCWGARTKEKPRPLPAGALSYCFMKPGLMPAAARSSAIRLPLRLRTCLVSDMR